MRQSFDIDPGVSTRLMRWFRAHQRRMPWRGETDPYKIWISEIMLQQTQVKTVIPYYERWIQRYPDVQTLAQSGISEVLRQWEGLGYYHRARNAHAAAQIISEQYHCLFPSTPESLRVLPGVGPYIAAAVTSIAFNYPAGVVDGNTMRVISRLLCIDGATVSEQFRNTIARSVETSFAGFEPRWMNQAWMELGALVCLPVPKCEDCPVSGDCKAFAEGKIDRFPNKIERRILPERKGAVFVIRTDSRLLLVQRPPSGLLGLLWELPGIMLDECSLDDFCNQHGLKIELEPLTVVRHQYTHFKQTLNVYSGFLQKPWKTDRWLDSRWVLPEELDLYAKPKVHIKALRKTGIIS